MHVINYSRDSEGSGARFWVSLVPRLSWGRGIREPGNNCTWMRQNLRILSVDYLIVYYQSSSKVPQALEKYLAIG